MLIAERVLGSKLAHRSGDVVSYVSIGATVTGYLVHVQACSMADVGI